MVTHTIVLGPKSRQTIRGLMEMRCRYATLTQVVVQCKQSPAQIPIKSGMTRRVSGTAIPTTGLYGLSLRFPGSCIPSYSTSECGSEGEEHSNHRIPVFISQDNLTTIYKPNMLFRDVTFGTAYDVEMFYLDSDHNLLSDATLAQLHSVTLTFHLEVDMLMPG